MSRTVFKIDGHELNLPITSYEPSMSVVDGSGTGRTAAERQPMFRDPAGTFWNLKLTLGGVVVKSQEVDFQKLISLVQSYGRDQFHSVTMKLPSGGLITQNMYCTSASFSMQRIDRWGESFWKPVSLSFIAEQAYYI